jgi:transporter family protein
MNYLLLVLISMSAFGVYFFLVKLLSEHIYAPVIALISNGVALVVVYLYLRFTRSEILPKRRKHVVYSLAVSAPLAIGVLALYLSLDQGPVSVVMPIVGINSMVAAVLGIAILKERITVQKGLGMVLAVAAIVLLNI